MDESLTASHSHAAHAAAAQASACSRVVWRLAQIARANGTMSDAISRINQIDMESSAKPQAASYIDPIPRARALSAPTLPATAADAAAIAAIYNLGIADRTATFETRPRSAADVEQWFDGVHPIIVAEANGCVIAFAGSSTYRPRDCYRGVAEFSVYVSRDARRRGAGRVALQALMAACAAAGFWKLVSRVFPENGASLALLQDLGFREVGVYEKHGQLDGEWKDVVIVERVLIDD